jgi:hypothetical protein
MRWISGWLVVMDRASFCRRTVFPALGGATIRQRCPLPMGEIRSTTRVDSSDASISRRMRSVGSSAVMFLNGVCRAQASGSSPFRRCTSASHGAWLGCGEGTAIPSTSSPVSSACFSMRSRGTRGSVGSGL